MPDLKQFLSDEIRRLARKEIKLAAEPLHAQLSAQRKTIFELNRRIKDLEKKLEKWAPAEPEKAAVSATEVKKIRLTPARITAIRMHLGLSQKDFAELLGSSTFSVCHWESGKARPRDKQKQKIASFRHVGKRELAKLLAEKHPEAAAEKADRKTVKRKKTVKAPKAEKVVKKATKAKKDAIAKSAEE